MDINFDMNVILQAIIDNTMNKLLFDMMPDTDEKTKKVMNSFFQELNSRGVSTQTILECLSEAIKQN